jgi:hypothetical protein
VTTKSEYDTKSNGGTATSAAAVNRSTADTVSDAADTVREAAANVRDVAATRLPEVTATTRSAIEDANRQMQSSSDEMLAMGGALSFGLAIGMLVGSAPRLFVAAALVPAVAMVLTLLNRFGWNRPTKSRSMQGG